MAASDHVIRNRAAWNEFAAEYLESGRRDWSSDEPRWGIWRVPESALQVLPEVAGRDVAEFGCGTGYVSAWLARLGARPVGIDNSPAQLRNALGFQKEFALSFPLIQADAEQAPLREAAYDLVISEYGACLWCDPYKWIPEAARVLRPGGQLIFMVHAALLMLCMPDASEEAADATLLRDYFGMHRFEWPDSSGVEFHLNHGDWLRLLRGHGFELEDLLEVRPPAGATTRYEFVTLDWARRWPAEEIWKARRI